MNTTNKTASAIHTILNTKSLAVVGASANRDKWGYMFIENIIAGGYEGELYGVNPREKEILGVKIFSSVKDLPDSVDTLIVCVPVNSVVDVINQAKQKRVKGIILITSGYREVGNNAMENDILKEIKGSEIMIVGPNIAGLNHLPNKFNPNVTKVFNTKGPMSIISQSGSVSAIIAEWAEDDGVGFNSLINLGNQIDLCESDFINYFSKDETTKSILLYIEGPKEPSRFLETLREIPVIKPIVVYKPGKTEQGFKTALSHTASIAGDDKIFSSACQQFGLVRAFDLESFYDYGKYFCLADIPEGNKVMVISSSGGLASILVDEIIQYGFELPQIPLQAVQELNKSLALPGSNFNNNPVDMPSFLPDNYYNAFKIVNKYDFADAYVILLADPVPGIEQIMPKIKEECKKPIVVVYIGGGSAGKLGTHEMIKQGIPVYPTPERAVRSLAKALWYSNFRRAFSDEQS